MKVKPAILGEQEICPIAKASHRHQPLLDQLEWKEMQARVQMEGFHNWFIAREPVKIKNYVVAMIFY